MQPRIRFPSFDEPQPLIGLAVLAKNSFLGIDQRPLLAQLVKRIERNPRDANALLDLSILLHLHGQPESAIAMQHEALSLRQTYHLPSAIAPSSVKLLAIMTSGDLTQNNAIEFLVAYNDVALDILFVAPDLPLPRELPPHDVAIVAICESDRNRPLLKQLELPIDHWPRPILNHPQRIARLTRNGACDLIPQQPGLHLPRTARIDRETLLAIAQEKSDLQHALSDGAFPLIARPVDTHKGQGQAKLDTPSTLLDYLQTRAEQEFYLTNFIDYRSPDGQFRKYRIVLIGGHPYLCHLAISDHWMVHYMSAGMTDSPVKRAEEAQAMQTFDQDFAKRHQSVLSDIARRLDLEYVGIDCGETPDGKLLIFEFDSGMTVHSMDPPELFPYKGPQMAKVFGAFRSLVADANSQARFRKLAA